MASTLLFLAENLQMSQKCDMIYVVQTGVSTMDHEESRRGSAYGFTSTALIVLALVGVLLYGVHFLQSSIEGSKQQIEQSLANR